MDRIIVAIPERQVTALLGESSCEVTARLHQSARATPDACGTSRLSMTRTSTATCSTLYCALARRHGLSAAEPFAQSIFESVAYSLRLLDQRSKLLAGDKMECVLRGANRWDAVKDKHGSPSTVFSKCQQLFCIACAIKVAPEVVLIDGTCSALDLIATLKGEDLIHDLCGRFTIVVVTYTIQQAAMSAT
jgi:phosphate transport system ATP-binding protein